METIQTATPGNSNKNRLFKNPIYQELFALGIPMIIQNLLSTAVSSADTIMLTFVGQASLSAVSLASNYTMVLHTLLYGISTGAALLTAQYYGKKDMRAIEAVQGIAFRFSFLIAGLFAVFCVFTPEMMMKFFTNDRALIEAGVPYVRWIGISYIFMSVSQIYIATLRSVNRVKIGTVLSTIAFTLNILLNAVFIFGLFGAPKMGAAGVGLATAISRLIELIGCIIVSSRSKDVTINLSYVLKAPKALLKDFVRMSLPAAGSDMLWSVAFSLFSVIMGHMDSDIVAANSIIVVVRNFGCAFSSAMASAGGILLGNILGSNDLVKAKDAAKRIVRATVLTGALGGVLILVAAPFILKYINLSPAAMKYLKPMLFIAAYYVMGVAVNTTLVCGIFRAGGDTRFALFSEAIGMWCYAVPFGFLAAFVFKWPPMLVYFILCTDEFSKWPMNIPHYKSGKWLKNITRDDLFDDTQAAGVGEP